MSARHSRERIWIIHAERPPLPIADAHGAYTMDQVEETMDRLERELDKQRAAQMPKNGKLLLGLVKALNVNIDGEIRLPAGEEMKKEDTDEHDRPESPHGCKLHGHKLQGRHTLDARSRTSRHASILASILRLRANPSIGHRPTSPNPTTNSGGGSGCRGE